ncbi:hypothetical protein QBC32DRAFT_382028 [Pseudoneurospora amorphoporcata]|uniref:NADH dehydrogenase [ubiquinone] 1 beta subcomplex subunit 7 n=1 Tax=Pseudoneurospora amorphoporcata TaxID=241081 RepID=A0AAN6NLQ6_9PEZI|nr:hypothetical protein QBC32DRAFT_382028 [Pseudoneurospora amorphoporcata]
MPFLPFSSPVPEEGMYLGNLTSNFSEPNEAVNLRMLHGNPRNGNRREYHLKPASPLAADYFPMLDVQRYDEDGNTHSTGDQEFQDRFSEKDTPSKEQVEKEFPYHHLTYVCYPMRAPDYLRRYAADGHIGNQWLRPPGPGKNEDFPEGLKLIFVNWLKKYDSTVPTGVAVVRPDGPQYGPNMLMPRHQRFPLEGEVPGEIAFCNMPDPGNGTVRTPQGFRFLFSPHLTSLPQTHAFQLHAWPEEHATHFSKFYNGDRVEKLIEMYKAARRPIPEAMKVRHVIAQVGRAFKFIHTGRTMPDKTQARGTVRGPPLEEEEEEWNDKEDERAANWTPTAHHDAHLANVWLHFVTQYERDHDRDRCLEHFNDCFPQVILGDFGLATNEKSRFGPRALRIDECPDLPERETWKDKGEFGLMLLHMLLAGRQDVLGFTRLVIPENWYQDYGDWLHDNYSWTLIEVVQRLWYVASLCDRGRMEGGGFDERMEVEYDKWKDGEVDERRRSRAGVESVRWATGQRMSTMPYQVPNRTKYSEKRRRTNRGDPDGELEAVAVPLGGKETLRSKARTLYTRKLRRPVTGAFFRHPPDAPDRVDKDKLWVSKTYRLERIRYRKPQAIILESHLKIKNRFTPPPTPRDVNIIEAKMFDQDPWGSRTLQWDREGPWDEATRQEMSDAKLPMAYRDSCAHLLIPLNRCRYDTYYLPWKCEVRWPLPDDTTTEPNLTPAPQDERHTYEKCQYVEFKKRVAKMDELRAAKGGARSN